MMRVLPEGWPDLHGFDGIGEGIRGGSDEHDEHTQTHTNPIQFRFTPDSPNHYPDRISLGRDTR